MAIGVTLFVVAILVVLVWVTIEIKRMKHKIFAIVLIGLILMAYFSLAVVFRGEEVDLASVSGLVSAGKLYFTFLGSVFSNLVALTSNAIKMDWMDSNGNGSSGK